MEGAFMEWSPDPSMWFSEENGMSLMWPPFVRLGAGAVPPWLPGFLRRATSIAVCAGVLLAAGKLVCVVVREIRRRRKALQNLRTADTPEPKKRDKPVVSTSPLSRTFTIIPSQARPVTAQPAPVPSTSSNETLQLNPDIPPVSSDVTPSDVNMSLEDGRQNTLETSEFTLSFTDDGACEADSLEYVGDSEDEDHTPPEEADRPPEVISRVLVTIL